MRKSSLGRKLPTRLYKFTTVPLIVDTKDIRVYLLVMAHDNKEIEIKVSVSKEQFRLLKKRLTSEALFVHKLHHIDTYYNPDTLNFMGDEVPVRWLSIRNRGAVTILNYKHWHKNDSGEYIHCDEYETKIEKNDQLEEIFKALSIKPIATVDKFRWKFKVGDEFEVCLDKVKKLKFFVEVESVKDFGSIEKTYEKIRAFADSLNLTDSQTLPGGYAYQIYLLQKKK